MTLQLKKKLKHKLNLDFLSLYQEPIIKGGRGGGGIKDKKKFKPQVAAFFLLRVFAFLCDTDSLRGRRSKGKGKGGGERLQGSH